VVLNYSIGTILPYLTYKKKQISFIIALSPEFYNFYLIQTNISEIEYSQFLYYYFYIVICRLQHGIQNNFHRFHTVTDQYAVLRIYNISVRFALIISYGCWVSQ